MLNRANPLPKDVFLSYQEQTLTLKECRNNLHLSLQEAFRQAQETKFWRRLTAEGKAALSLLLLRSNDRLKDKAKLFSSMPELFDLYRQLPPAIQKVLSPSWTEAHLLAQGIRKSAWNSLVLGEKVRAITDKLSFRAERSVVEESSSPPYSTGRLLRPEEPGQKDKEPGKNKKRLLRLAMIAAFVVPALLGIAAAASAQGANQPAGQSSCDNQPDSGPPCSATFWNMEYIIGVAGPSYNVAAEGDYAYSTNNNMKVYDVSNPANPIFVGQTDNFPELVRGITVVETVTNTLAYVSDGEHGLYVVDVTNPVSPTVIGGYDTYGFTENTVVSGTIAYVADRGAGLCTLDVSNPTNINPLDCYDTVYYAMDVAVDGNIAYVAVSDYLKIINVSNPGALWQMGYLPIPGHGMSGIVKIGDHVTMSDWQGWFTIVNVANPYAPVQKGSILLNPYGQIWDVGAYDEYAYTVDPYSVQVVSIADPFNPTVVGFYKPNDVYHYALRGIDAGYYTFVNNGAEFTGGLEIVSFTGEGGTPYPGCTPTPTVTLTPTPTFTASPTWTLVPPTATATETSTATYTATSTATSTSTETSTPTLTSTPSPTFTSTVIWTFTPTHTPSPSHTATSIATSTSTATETSTATLAPSPTWIIVFTASPSPTPTPSPPPASTTTSTATSTGTLTPPPTATITPTPPPTSWTVYLPFVAK